MGGVPPQILPMEGGLKTGREKVLRGAHTHFSTQIDYGDEDVIIQEVWGC